MPFELEWAAFVPFLHPACRLMELRVAFLVRNPNDLTDYTGEVVPEAGTLVSFSRSEASYHGFEPVECERRSLQMYWIREKRLAPGTRR
jgi:hypothetical protein